MARIVSLFLIAAAFAACSAPAALPGGYAISYGDRGKAWLLKPDGSVLHAGLIKKLHRDDRTIVLVAFPVSYGGQAAAPYPMVEDCLIAFVIDAQSQTVKQVPTSEAERLAAAMTEVESSGLECLEGI